MLKNYFITGLRSLRRNTGTSLMNVGGLAIGLAVCLVIGLYVIQESGYDTFHADNDRIYRVVQEETDGPGLVWSGPNMGRLLAQDFPQIEQVVRLIDGGSGYGSNALITYEEGEEVRSFNEEGFLYADPDFFQFFTFPLKEGDPSQVLNRPGTVVVTETTARKYFGVQNPIGRSLMLEGEHPLEVTGVAYDPPDRSHIDFGFITSFQTFYSNMGMAGEVNSFWWPPSHTYLKLSPDASARELDEQLAAFSQRHRDADDAERMDTRLQALTDIWLGPDYSGQIQPGGSGTYLLLFSTVALFVLLLACVNFVNLSTARAMRRAREVGVRKAIGAGRAQLIFQFLVESVLLSLAAMMAAILLTELLLPLFNSVADTSISVPYTNPQFWMVGLSTVLVTGLASGLYPAFSLSGFRAALVHQKQGRGGWMRGAALRKSLVVFQFAVTIVLLAGTTVIYRQLQFVNETRLGFDKEQVLVLPADALLEEQNSATVLSAPRYETLRSELMSRTAVAEVTDASSRPGMGSEGGYVWEAEGLPPEPNRQVPLHLVGSEFFEMMGLQMAAGRPLRADDPADIGTVRIRDDQSMASPVHENRAVVINETAAARLEWSAEEAIGRSMRMYIQENGVTFQDYRGTVVGVVEDYHTSSLREPIGPAVYISSRAPGGTHLSLRHILVKLNEGDHQQALQEVEQVWQEVVEGYPFEASFLDESLAEMYRSETKMARLINIFTLLAVAIACLGLFGLASYAAEQRHKEIGVRKVLGATVSGILALFTLDFMKLVALGFLIAIPVSWYVMNRWLADFAYRIEIGPGIFLLAGGAALLIALATVSWQSIRAALANPVDSLRSE